MKIKLLLVGVIVAAAGALAINMPSYSVHNSLSLGSIQTDKAQTYAQEPFIGEPNLAYRSREPLPTIAVEALGNLDKEALLAAQRKESPDAQRKESPLIQWIKNLLHIAAQRKEGGVPCDACQRFDQRIADNRVAGAHMD